MASDSTPPDVKRKWSLGAKTIGAASKQRSISFSRATLHTTAAAAREAAASGCYFHTSHYYLAEGPAKR